VDDDEKLVLDRTSKVCSLSVIESILNGPAPTVSIISESGLYKLIMRSDKAEAREFQNWVTKEVLPSIRQTGCYALEQGQEMPLPANEVAPSAQPRWRTSPCIPPPPIPSTPPPSFRP
jgi:prophage antirepressor-like protein